jgi:hypothetical protein
VDSKSPRTDCNAVRTVHARNAAKPLTLLHTNSSDHHTIQILPTYRAYPQYPRLEAERGAIRNNECEKETQRHDSTVLTLEYTVRLVLTQCCTPFDRTLRVRPNCGIFLAFCPKELTLLVPDIVALARYLASSICAVFVFLVSFFVHSVASCDSLLS